MLAVPTHSHHRPRLAPAEPPPSCGPSRSRGRARLPLNRPRVASWISPRTPSSRSTIPSPPPRPWRPPPPIAVLKSPAERGRNRLVRCAIHFGGAARRFHVYQGGSLGDPPTSLGFLHFVAVASLPPSCGGVALRRARG